MANRMRRPDQQLETRVWMGSQPDRHHRRRKDLGRTRSPNPQPGKNQRPGQLTALRTPPRPTAVHADSSADRPIRPRQTISGRSNYWKREALAFSSGLLIGWPGPLVPVHCYGIEEVSKSQAWIWLEAREGAGPHALWTIEQLASAAYDFGALAAQWQSKLPDVRHYPWLAQRWLRGWVALVRIYAVDHFLEHDGCGSGSAVEPFLNGSTRRRIAELISDADDLLAGFDSQPVTLAHHDPQRGNLFAAAPNESPARTVAIDWGFFGLAPVGSDLGLHIGQNIMSWGIDQRRAAEHYRASTAAYISGLQDYGWSGDVDSVRFARATAAALNAGTWLAMEVSWLCPDMAERFGSDDSAWPTRVAAKHGISTTTVVERWASGFNYVLDLANEARRLLPHVHC
jgi:hypothetical protein